MKTGIAEQDLPDEAVGQLAESLATGISEMEVYNIAEKKVKPGIRKHR
jgi:hypothetical protein